MTGLGRKHPHVVTPEGGWAAVAAAKNAGSHEAGRRAIHLLVAVWVGVLIVGLTLAVIW
jgi:hypothetical protein